MDKTKDSLAVQQVDDANAVSDSLTGKIDHNAAAQFEASETSATFSEAVKNNKTALGWCMYMFFICIVWGYDGLAGNVVVSIVQFRKDFGHPYNGDYVVDANWQLGFQGATMLSMIIGAFAAGVAVNKWGRQPALAASFIISIAGVFAQVFATTPAHFLGGKVLTGLPMGCFTTAAPTYAAEISPLKFRGAIMSGMNFAIVLGQLIGNGVLRETSSYEGKASYRILFATQWGFAAVGIAVLPWFPESPYWLVSNNRIDKARKNITRIHGKDADVEGRLGSIAQSLARSSSDQKGQGTLVDCFRSDQIRRTLVASSLFFIQVSSGNLWVLGYLGYFLQLAGMKPSTSFDITVGVAGVQLLGNMFGWYFVERMGRRGTALTGSIILSVALLIIGILGVIDAPGSLWAQIAFMAIWAFVYQGTLGSVAWPIVSETATSRLRAPTQALANITNGLTAAVWSFALPYAVNPDEGNLQAKIAFIFGGILVLATVLIYFTVPETQNRSFGEIDELWNRKIPARQFAKTKLDQPVNMHTV